MLGNLNLFFSRWGIISSAEEQLEQVSISTSYNRGEDRLEVQRLGRKLSIASIQQKKTEQYKHKAGRNEEEEEKGDAQVSRLNNQTVKWSKTHHQREKMGESV